MFLFMQNIFIVPALQHGCRAKPLFLSHLDIAKKHRLLKELLTAVLHNGLSSYLTDWITHPQLEFIIEAKQDILQACM